MTSLTLARSPAWSSATTNSTPLRPRRRRPRRKSFQDERLSRLAISTARIWRRPSQSTPMAIRTAWLVTTAPFPHLLNRRIEDEIGTGLFEGASRKGLEAFVQTLVEGGDGRGRKAWPPNSSVIDLTFRVETPCTYVSASVATSACSER